MTGTTFVLTVHHICGHSEEQSFESDSLFAPAADIALARLEPCSVCAYKAEDVTREAYEAKFYASSVEAVTYGKPDKKLLRKSRGYNRLSSKQATEQEIDEWLSDHEEELS